MLMLPAGAAGTPTLSISSGEVKAGETVTLTVSIKDNPGIAATIVYFYYDTASFEVDPDSDIELKGVFASKGAFSTNVISALKENGLYDGLAGKDGVFALWYNTSGDNTTSVSPFLSITLKAKSDVANGDHEVKVAVSSNNTCDTNGVPVEILSSSGIVTVSGGTNEKQPDTVPENIPQFSDISGHWAESYIKQSAELGLVEGYLGLYRPNDTMTRAEFVTILWRAMGEPKPIRKASFTDLTQDWYKDAVAWAEQNKVVNGMGEGKFEPNGQVTREQLVTILHRLAGTPMGGELMFSGIYDTQFSDSAQIGSWAKAAMYWSVYESIYCGKNSVEIGNKLFPKDPANRAQIAVMMINYLNKQ